MIADLIAPILLGLMIRASAQRCLYPFHQHVRLPGVDKHSYRECSQSNRFELKECPGNSEYDLSLQACRFKDSGDSQVLSRLPQQPQQQQQMNNNGGGRSGENTGSVSWPQAPSPHPPPQLLNPPNHFFSGPIAQPDLPIVILQNCVPGTWCPHDPQKLQYCELDGQQFAQCSGSGWVVKTCPFATRFVPTVGRCVDIRGEFGPSNSNNILLGQGQGQMPSPQAPPAFWGNNMVQQTSNEPFGSPISSSNFGPIPPLTPGNGPDFFPRPPGDSINMLPTNGGFPSPISPRQVSFSNGQTMGTTPDIGQLPMGQLVVIGTSSPLAGNGQSMQQQPSFSPESADRWAFPDESSSTGPMNKIHHSSQFGMSQFPNLGEVWPATAGIPPQSMVMSHQQQQQQQQQQPASHESMGNWQQQMGNTEPNFWMQNKFPAETHFQQQQQSQHQQHLMTQMPPPVPATMPVPMPVHSAMFPPSMTVSSQQIPPPTDSSGIPQTSWPTESHRNNNFAPEVSNAVIGHQQLSHTNGHIQSMTGIGPQFVSNHGNGASLNPAQGFGPMTNGQEIFQNQNANGFGAFVSNGGGQMTNGGLPMSNIPPGSWMPQSTNQLPTWPSFQSGFPASEAAANRRSAPNQQPNRTEQQQPLTGGFKKKLAKKL